MYTLSEENYLKAIYRLQADGGKVTASSIAENLGNNPASVVDMLKKITTKRLIKYDKKSGAILTEKGQRIALQVVRKHRLWEVFLHEKLGYSWDEVHDIAEQMEHIQHEDLDARLDKFLGFPKYDPHGDPIPQANGTLAKTSKTSLSAIQPGNSCHVVGIKDTNATFLRYLQKLNIGIGTKITVAEIIPFDASVVIMIGKQLKTTVSGKFAENVLVEP
jgi:DtxR family transcriptional regulator, Mn-dependent transcriptional regulator